MSEKLYVLLKRDLYESPEHLGYTGIKELAGAWPLSLVTSQTVPLKDHYDSRDRSSYALLAEDAPDFTASCFHDLAISHLQKNIASKDAENARLKRALENIAAPRDCGCSPVCQCNSQESLQIECEAFQDIARAALKEKADA